MEDSLVENEARRNEQEEMDELQRIMVYPKPIFSRKLNGRWAYQCESCGLVLYSEKILNRHMAKHNEEEANGDEVQEDIVEDQEMVVPPVPKKRPSYHSCAFCSKVFSSNSHLERHMRPHLNERPFWCKHPNCEQDFAYASVLQNHLLSHPNETPHKCSKCERSFKSVQALNIHKKTMHQLTKTSFKHTCKFCLAVFEKRRGLKCHLETHIDPLSRPSFVCPECKLKFTWNNHLRRHMKHHHNKEKPIHKCLYCRRIFLSDDDLREHKQKEGHHRGKHFGCSVCNMKYPSLKNLNRHLKTDRHRKTEEDHKKAEKLVENCARVQQALAEKNWVLVPSIRCKSCDSTFPTEQGLTQHVQKIHNLPEERPFSCEVQGCDKTFKRKDHLKTHMEVGHSNLRKYVCSRCGKRYKRSHVLKHHNVRHPDCDVVIRDEQPKQRGKKSEHEGKLKNKKHSVNLKNKEAPKLSEFKGRLLQNTRSSTRLRNKEEEVGK